MTFPLSNPERLLAKRLTFEDSYIILYTYPNQVNEEIIFGKIITMDYPQSSSILSKIKKADKILLSVHKNPDLDTVGSAAAMDEAITYWQRPLSIGKHMSIDSSSYDRVTGSKEIYLPKNLETVVIDHHITIILVQMKVLNTVFPL